MTKKLLLLSIGLSCGLLVGNYRGKVADDAYWNVVRRVNDLERICMERRSDWFKVTKHQAWNFTTAKDKARRQR